MQVYEADEKFEEGYDPECPLLINNTPANEQTISSASGVYVAYFQQVTVDDPLVTHSSFIFKDARQNRPCFSFLLSDDETEVLPRKRLKGKAAKRFWDGTLVVVLMNSEE